MNLINSTEFSMLIFGRKQGASFTVPSAEYIDKIFKLNGRTIAILKYVRI